MKLSPIKVFKMLCGLASVLLAQPLSLVGSDAVEDHLPLALQSQDESTVSTSDHKDYATFLSAESALQSGFPSIAEGLLVELLERLDEPNHDLVNRIRETLVVCYLNQGKIDEAFQQISNLDETSPRKEFLELMWAYYGGATTEQIEQRIAGISPDELRQEDALWLGVMEAIVLIRQANSVEARVLLDKLKPRTSGQFQESWIEAMVWREEILNGPTTDQEIFSLKTQIENAVNPIVASQLVQQHAIVLWRSGRQQEAIRSIESQLANISNQYGEQKDRLLMFLALLSGNNSGKAKVALESILERSGELRIRRMAYYYWLSNLDFSDSSKTNALDRLMRKGREDPLYNEFLYADALRKFFAGNLQSVKTEIEAILESNASDQLKESALRVLVASNWSQNPPQYRLAAEYLLRLRSFLKDKNTFEYNRMALLTGDSYYLNGDYENAIPYYAGLLEDPGFDQDIDQIIYKITDAYIQLRNLEAVGPILDRLYSSGAEVGLKVWGSEWNYVLKLVQKGSSERAIERLSNLFDLLNTGTEDRWKFDAKQRVQWMLAYLQFQNGAFAATLNLCEQSILSYEAMGASESSNSKMVYDENRLLKARALLATGSKDDALELLESVREDGNETSASASYIIEAREAWSNARGNQAQRVLMKLAEEYPTSRYAPVAIYEVALSKETQANANSDQEAVRLYERIAVEFPNHPLAFISKLKQGDILRKTNQFAAAIPFYENLANDYSDDPRAYLIDIALGECYLALGSTRSDYLDQAIRVMERIFDLSHLPAEVRIEAGTKAATGLLEANRDYRAQDLLWRVLSIIYDQPEMGDQLGSSGRYWLARACLVLSEHLKETNRTIELQRVYELSKTMNLPGSNLILN